MNNPQLESRRSQSDAWLFISVKHQHYQRRLASNLHAKTNVKFVKNVVFGKPNHCKLQLSPL